MGRLGWKSRKYRCSTICGVKSIALKMLSTWALTVLSRDRDPMSFRGPLYGSPAVDEASGTSASV